MTVVEDEYPCGCRNVTDQASGVVKAAGKCLFHVGHQQDRRTPREYYESMGIMPNGVPQASRLIDELQRFWRCPMVGAEYNSVLEIGCGCSLYVPLFLRNGWVYTGIDTCQYAAEWTANAYDVYTRIGSVEGWREGKQYDLVLAAHVLEHVTDAPAVVAKIARLLRVGGQLVGIVPNGTDDPTNPDHLWFFTPQTLTALLTAAGFTQVETAEHKVVKHERFIYFAARKAPVPSTQETPQ